ncbi:MAG TPA: ATP-binding cassette domain-containing protein, partial [Candidatus Obscuribacter sp.]|nr:ATP-binding cassette domain-containing protein [Candidatus Obscuribacter sp.]
MTRASHPYYQPGVIVSGNENLLELRDVAKTYGEHQVQALKHVNLVVRKGSFACLMGQSGCGKSTLLNIIAGLDSPSSGSVVFDGIDMSALKDEEVTRIRGEKIGFVFQFFNLLSTLTVEENVSLPLELTTNLSHKARRAKVLEMLERVGMQNRIDFFPA